MKTIQEIITIVKNASSWLLYRRAAGQIQKLRDHEPQLFNTRIKIAVLSSFTADPLRDYLTVEAAREKIDVQIYSGGYNQVSQEVVSPDSRLYQFAPEITFLIAEPQSLERDPMEAAEKLLQLSQAWKKKGAGVLVVCTFLAPPPWPLHILPSAHQAECSKANRYLQEHFAEDPQVQVCDLDGLAAWHGYANAISPEMEAMARIPFDEGFLALLAKKFVSYLKTHTGLIRKCLVLDCDNTLWGGIIGEDGFDGIALGPDWPGREYVNFQKAVLELYEQGVILTINSKNNEADVMQVLREHPHMILREDHFGAICVNWDPKPQNTERLAAELNIGLDSMVFVDDNPAERQLMRQMLPDVEVLELSANPSLYEKTLRETNFFARASLTEEDKKRGQMYAAQRQRQALQKTVTSLNDYLKSLEMICSIRLADAKDVKRAAQLTQRTNQFNLTTRRYTEADIQRMLDSPDWAVYVLGLKDKFGDNGTVGLALVQKHPTEAWSGSDTIANAESIWRIDTFLMSCRVIGRQAEDALVDLLCRDAAAAGVNTIEAEYIKTPKNAIAADFWDKMGFEQNRDSHGAGMTNPACDNSATHYHLNLKNYLPKRFEYLTINNQ